MALPPAFFRGLGPQASSPAEYGKALAANVRNLGQAFERQRAQKRFSEQLEFQKDHRRLQNVIRFRHLLDVAKAFE